MNEAMIGVSSQVVCVCVPACLPACVCACLSVYVSSVHMSPQVQQLLQKMQLPVVTEAIEALIQARPAVAAAMPTISVASSGGSSSSLSSMTEKRGRGGGGEGGRGGEGGGEGEEGGGGEKEKVGRGGDRLEVRGDEEAKTASLNRSTRHLKWSSKQLSLRRSKPVSYWVGLMLKLLPPTRKAQHNLNVHFTSLQCVNQLLHYPNLLPHSFHLLQVWQWMVVQFPSWRRTRPRPLPSGALGQWPPLPLMISHAERNVLVGSVLVVFHLLVVSERG